MRAPGGLSRSAVSAGALAATLLAPALPAQTPDDAFLRSARANAVRVQLDGAAGFGFLVGLGDGTLLVATAEHLLDEGTDGLRICFHDDVAPCTPARVVYLDDPLAPGDPDLDLVVLEAEYPSGLAWRPDLMGAPTTAGEPVWFIGRNEAWYIPPRPGTVTEPESAARVAYAGLPVAGGTSGAPVLGRTGIVALHSRSDGADGTSYGIPLGLVRDRVVERLGAQWALVPRAMCGEGGARDDLLANRWVIVRFPWYRAAPALDAMARLRCVGALPLAVPLSGRAETSEREIVYRAGDLRSARMLQALLAPLGRIETRLGSPDGELELTLH